MASRLEVQTTLPSGGHLTATLSRVARRVAVGVLAIVLGYELWVAATNPLGVLHYPGIDYSTYMEATRRALSGGGFYASWQFNPAQPDPSLRSVLYPPLALLVFVPMSFLPPIAWWVVPVGTIAYVAWNQCRTPWQRVALLAAIASPPDLTALITGNGTLWVAAAVVAANRWAWPSAFIVLKPTFAPWAIIGVRSRSWWVALGGLVVVSLALLPMWLDWLRVMEAWYASPGWSTGHRQGSPGITYLLSAFSAELALLFLATTRTARLPRPHWVGARSILRRQQHEPRPDD